MLSLATGIHVIVQVYFKEVPYIYIHVYYFIMNALHDQSKQMFLKPLCMKPPLVTPCNMYSAPFTLNPKLRSFPKFRVNLPVGL